MVHTAGGQEAEVGMRLKAVDDALVSFDGADDVSCLPVPDKERSIIRSCADVLAVPGQNTIAEQ